MHVRRQVREAVRAALDGLAPGRPDVNRADAWPKEAGLTIGVRTPQEISRDTDMDGGQERTVAVMIDLTLKGQASDALSDGLDAAAATAERAVIAAGDLGGIAQAVSYRGARLGMDGSSEKLAGLLTLSFDIVVYTREADPETAL